MAFLRDRRVIVLGGMAVALLGGLIAAALIMGRHGDAAQDPPASQGGLIVQTGRDDDIKLDPKHPLRCFVNGQLVGELPLRDCARRNGVATGALDVGLDPSGALAAANGADVGITPLPEESGALPPGARLASDDVVETAGTASAGGGPAACWSYAGGAWSRLPADLAIAACVRALYAGRCARAGAPLYGRWANRTLRLTPGRVEISPDNRDFHLLVEQGPGCSIPAFG